MASEYGVCVFECVPIAFRVLWLASMCKEGSRQRVYVKKGGWNVFLGKSARAYAHVYLRRCARSTPGKGSGVHARMRSRSRECFHMRTRARENRKKKMGVAKREDEVMRIAGRGKPRERELSIHISIYVCACAGFAWRKKMKRDITPLGHTHPAKGTPISFCFFGCCFTEDGGALRAINTNKHIYIYIYS